MTKLFIFLSFIFALLQGTVLPVVFIEGFIVVFFLITRTSSLGAPLLASGLIFDLLQNQTLGVTSLIFLSALALTLLLKERVILRHSFILSVFVVILNAIREILLFGYIEPLPLILIFGFAALVFNLIWRPDIAGKIRI